jgi:hypothetical protein
VSTQATPATIERQVTEVSQLVTGAVIRNVEDYRSAGLLSDNIARLRKAIDETFNPIISKAHAAHAEAIAQKKKFSIPLEAYQRKIDGLILGWDREQEAIRRKAEAELAEKQRQAADDQALAEAEELVRQGEHALAEALLQQQAEAPKPVVALPKVTPKLEGFSKRTVWRFRVENAELVPREYMRVDEIKIGGVVRALKDKTKIPGIKVYPEDIAGHRTGG